MRGWSEGGSGVHEYTRNVRAECANRIRRGYFMPGDDGV